MQLQDFMVICRNDLSEPDEPNDKLLQRNVCKLSLTTVKYLTWDFKNWKMEKHSDTNMDTVMFASGAGRRGVDLVWRASTGQTNR
ncbi:unnamed protein product [Leptidea sinapis]|uniref:Uncharacterized protein n=1 Tax=Leptidea sinapis TaxID=189913 RepID=A0A5E4QPN9_9NEOP|nr:unnamed protein product [Leptidea sinapis]